MKGLRVYNAGRPPELPPTAAHRRRFNRMGWALVVFMLGPMAVQYVPAVILSLLAPQALGESWVVWALSVLSQYFVGFSAAALLLLSVPAAPTGGEGPLSPVGWLKALVVSVGVLMVSNILTLFLISLLDALRGITSTNPLDASLADYPMALTLLSTCVLAPVFEELFFRSLLLKRLRPYGARFAAFASALAFSLLHGNLYQMLYAFTLGLVFAWVVLRTGKVWQTIALHAAINFLGGGFLTALLGEAGTMAAGFLYLGCTVGGAALLIRRRSGLSLPRGREDMTEGRKWGLFLLNPGMIAFCAAACGFAVLFLL